MRRTWLLGGVVMVGAAVLATAASSIESCAYAPDGTMRWHHMPEWRQNSRCDVWDGIVPEKPISAFEIRNADLNYIARVYPDRSVIVATTTEAGAAFGRRLHDDGRWETEDAETMRGHGRDVTTGELTDEQYDRVVSLIAPMRDYAGWTLDGKDPVSFFFGDTLSQEEQRRVRFTMLQLDNPKTKLFACHLPINHGSAWSIAHWDATTGVAGGVSSSFGLGCWDAAVVAGAARVDEAAHLIMQASGARK